MVIVVEENKDYDQIIDNPKAPICVEIAFLERIDHESDGSPSVSANDPSAGSSAQV
jgi:hypothetical protein